MIQGAVGEAEELIAATLAANPLAAVELQGLLVELERKRGRSEEALSHHHLPTAM